MDLQGEFVDLTTDINNRQRHIEDQILLISVLDHDGHNTIEQQTALKFERKQLAYQTQRQMKLLQAT